MTIQLPDVGTSSRLGDRMRAAIKQNGFRDVKAFCRDKDIAYESLISVLSGRRNLSEERAILFAEILDVPVKWLQHGPSGQNGHNTLDRSIPVKQVISYNFTPTVDLAAGDPNRAIGNPLRLANNPHLIKRVEPPIAIPGLALEKTYAAICDGTTDVALIDGTMMLCSDYPTPEKPTHRKPLPQIGYLIAETRQDTHRVLPFLRQYGDIYACPAEPHKAWKLPMNMPSHHDILAVIHYFWWDPFRLEK